MTTEYYFLPYIYLSHPFSPDGVQPNGRFEVDRNDELPQYLLNKVPAEERRWALFDNFLEFSKPYQSIFLIDVLNLIQDRYDECLVILDHTEPVLEQLRQIANDKITIMTGFTMLSWYMSCCIASNQKFLKQPAQSSKFLFYAGKFNKYHRAAIMDSFIHHNLLTPQHCDWSCRLPDAGTENYIELQRILRNHPFYIKDIEQFRKYDRDLDWELQGHSDPQHGHLHHIGVPFGLEDYHDVGFTFITETRCVGFEDYEVNGFHNWISEKTVRPLLVGIPFILYASTNTYEFLESLGINTYREYHGFSTDGYTTWEQMHDVIYNQLPQAVRKMQEICSSDSGHTEMCRIAKQNQQRIRELFVEEVKKFKHLQFRVHHDFIPPVGNFFQHAAQIYSPAPGKMPTDFFDIDSLTINRLMLQ